jgi:hypothetical protein
MNATVAVFDRWYAAVGRRTATVAGPVVEGREKGHSSTAANSSSVTRAARERTRGRSHRSGVSDFEWAIRVLPEKGPATVTKGPRPGAPSAEAEEATDAPVEKAVVEAAGSALSRGQQSLDRNCVRRGRNPSPPSGLGSSFVATRSFDWLLSPFLSCARGIVPMPRRFACASHPPSWKPAGHPPRPGPPSGPIRCRMSSDTIHGRRRSASPPSPSVQDPSVAGPSAGRPGHASTCWEASWHCRIGPRAMSG